MPIKDPSKRADYHSNYYRHYASAKADEIRQRRAAWYQANKARLREKEKADYHAERTRVAIDTLNRLAS